MPCPDAYELQSLEEIRAWKRSQLQPSGPLIRKINEGIDAAGDTVLKIPGIGWIIERTVKGLTGIANDVAQWSVRPESILREYRTAGFDNVTGLGEIYKLSLKDVDQVIGWLGAKYKSIATVEGGTAGWLGP